MFEKPLEQIASEIKTVSCEDLEKAFIGQVKLCRDKTEIIRELEDSRCFFCKTPVKIIAAAGGAQCVKTND